MEGGISGNGSFGTTWGEDSGVPRNSGNPLSMTRWSRIRGSGVKVSESEYEGRNLWTTLGLRVRG
jgi:hypothetical protein